MASSNTNRLTKSEQELIHQQILEIEQVSTGKVAIHVDDYCKGDPYFKAVKIFQELGLLQHIPQNGLLIYVALEDKKYALVADKALTSVLENEQLNKEEAHFLSALQSGSAFDAIRACLSRFETTFRTQFAKSSATTV